MSACPTCGHDPDQLDLSDVVTPIDSARKARRSDRDTARDAAKRMEFPARGQRLTLLRALALRPHGMTCERLARLCGINYVSASTRLTELASGGWIVDSGRRQPTSTGTHAIVWVVTESAVRTLESAGERVVA